jgi:hypothetical protein
VADSEAVPVAPGQHADKASGGVFEVVEGATRARRDRYRLREAVWKITTQGRVSNCGRVRCDASRPVGVAVDVSPGGERRARFDNIQTCESPWCCPVCAAKIRAERAAEVAEAAVKHMHADRPERAAEREAAHREAFGEGVPADHWSQRAGGVEFLSLTFAHGRGDNLADTFDAMKRAWARVTTGRRWVKDRESFGIEGYVRTDDVTWSEANGWHPHLHVLIFTKSPLTASERRKLHARMFGRWADFWEAEGYDRPDIRRSPMEPAASPEDVGDYLAAAVLKEKEGGGGGGLLALEATRHDLKRGRRVAGVLRLTPFDMLRRIAAVLDLVGHRGRTLREADDAEVLDHSAGDGLAVRRLVGLWREYERATHGRRSISWTRGLKKRLAVGEDEPGAEAEAEESELRMIAEIDVETYATVAAERGGLARFVEAIEESDAAALAFIDAARERAAARRAASERPRAPRPS